VSAALKEDLLRVKDALDLHLRAGGGNVADLQPQAEALDRIGDALHHLALLVDHATRNARWCRASPTVAGRPAKTT